MALYAPLLTPKRLIQVKTETTKGTLETASLVDLLAYDIEINPADAFVERHLSSAFLGNFVPGTLEYTYAGVARFKVEMRCGATAILATGIPELLKACGLALTGAIYAPTSVPATQSTVTIVVYTDGKKKALAGAMGNVTISPENGRIILDFEFKGVWQTPSDVALPTPTFGAFQPLPWGHTSNVFTLAALAIRISSFTFKTGNAVVPRYNCGKVLYYLISDRNPTIDLDLEADLVASGHVPYTDWLAGTSTLDLSLAITNGTRTVTLFTSNLQYREIKEGDRDGIQIDNVTAQFVATSGDDEFSLTIA